MTQASSAASPTTSKPSSPASKASPTTHGFLLHNRPRESDLEYSLYQQLFHFIAKLETAIPSSFQYIITTTDSPPDTLQDTHVRLRLDGSQAKGKLYKVDL